MQWKLIRPDWFLTAARSGAYKRPKKRTHLLCFRNFSIRCVARALAAAARPRSGLRGCFLSSSFLRRLTRAELFQQFLSGFSLNV